MKIFEVIDQPKVYISSVDDPENEFTVNDLRAWAQENNIPYKRIKAVLNPNDKKHYGTATKGYRFRLEGQALSKRILKPIIIPSKVYVSKVDDPENEFTVNDLLTWAQENNIPYKQIKAVLNPNDKKHYGTSIRGYRFRLEGQTLPTYKNPRVSQVYVSTVDEPDKEDFIPNIQVWAKEHNISTQSIATVSNPATPDYGRVVKGKYRFRRPGSDPLPPLPQFFRRPEYNLPGFNKNDQNHIDFYERYRRIRDRKNYSGNWNLKDVWQVFLNQNQRCALTGMPFNRDRNYGFDIMSIDRIDSTKPYSVNNIQFLRWCVNRAKQNLQQHEFIKLCQEISARRSQITQLGEAKKAPSILISTVDDPENEFTVDDLSAWAAEKGISHKQILSVSGIGRDGYGLDIKNYRFRRAGDPLLPPPRERETYKTRGKTYLGHNILSPHNEVRITDPLSWARENGFDPELLRKYANPLNKSFGNATKSETTGEIWRFRQEDGPSLPKYTGRYSKRYLPNKTLEDQGFNPTNPVHQVWRQSVDKIKTRGGIITLEEAWHIFHNVQGERCAYSGRPFLIGESWKPKSRSNRQSEEDKVGIRAKGNWAPSPDRRDPSGGYTADNVAFVCLIVNIGKNDLPEEMYFTMCDQVANFNKS